MDQKLPVCKSVTCHRAYDRLNTKGWNVTHGTNPYNRRSLVEMGKGNVPMKLSKKRKEADLISMQTVAFVLYKKLSIQKAINSCVDQLLEFIKRV